MRVRVLLLLAACGVCVGITALIVQAQNTRVDVNRDGVRVEVTTGNTQQKTTILRSRDVLGLRVYNAANESLGKIEDIAVDPNAGKIRYAVLSFGGILGLGDKYFAVPWPKLSFVAKGATSAGTPKESYIVLDVSKQTLKTRRVSTRTSGRTSPMQTGTRLSSGSTAAAGRRPGDEIANGDRQFPGAWES